MPSGQYFPTEFERSKLPETLQLLNEAPVAVHVASIPAQGQNNASLDIETSNFIERVYDFLLFL